MNKGPIAAGTNGARFMFATGIECSCPMITGRDGRDQRVDQLESSFHYRHWREDLALVSELGLRFLRYGPPYHLVQQGPNRFDWEFTDQVFAELARLRIEPIVDLCHFGVPDWIGNFQNPDFPELFAEYAQAFARRFPWVKFYTPVNEIYVCAKLSTLSGLWNERRRNDEAAFVTALRHLSKANLLAIAAILQVRNDAAFIQSESAEYFHLGSTDPLTQERVHWENERRFLSFDLLYSVEPCAELVSYLLDNGMTRDEYRWFMHHGLGDRIVMGNDFYERNEQVVTSGGELKPAGEVFGWAAITHEYYERYRRPVMHTETNTLNAADGPRWLWKEFFNVRHLRKLGVPVIGFTWYSLVDQMDWGMALDKDFGVVTPVGLYDLSRRPRPVAGAFRELLREFGGETLLPGSSVFSLLSPEDASLEQRPARPSNRHLASARSTSSARVSIARTVDRHIDARGVERLLRDALEPLGGARALIQPGVVVLIKPNQTLWRTSADGVTTDPRLIAALVRLARECGAHRVLVGECSSCGQVTREIMRITGVAAAVRDAGGELVYFDEAEQVEIDVPGGKLLQRIAVPRPLLDADVVIACPKLKTHFLDPITGALKLWVGAVRQDTMHRLHRDAVEETVAELLTVTRPDFCVMDAIVAGEGDGPVANRGRFVGCILASTDPVALDTVAGDLAGFDGASMRFPRAAAARGVGVCDRSRIELVGANLAEARVALVPTQMQDWHERYAVRLIVGEGVTLAGTLGHFKGFADFWHKDHIWQLIVALRGKPTFMIGRAVDPDFERHLKQGPYFVLDDVALEHYKHDPRVTFVPGSPIGNEMMPVIMAALGVDRSGRAVETLMKRWSALKGRRLHP